MTETSIQTYSEGFMQIKLNRAKLEIAIYEAQQKLSATPEYKELEELKRQLSEETQKEETIKNGILESMIQRGLKVVEFDDGKFTRKQNPAALKINDEELIPSEYKREKVEIVIDKRAIKEAMQNGEQVNGCELTHSYSLVFTSK